LRGPHIDLALADRELQLSAPRIAVNPAEIPAKIFGAPNGRASFLIMRRLPGRATPPITLNFLGSYLTVEPPRVKFITPEDASCRIVKPSGFTSLAK
jgi:hypothetical protein